MPIQLLQFSTFTHEITTRFPFRYGITAMTQVPHLLVRARLMVDGNEQMGIAAETLPPKWFTKDPTTSFDQDLADMRRVIQRAGSIAVDVGAVATVFDLWHAAYQAQSDWAEAEGYPPLLWNLGVSLVERAVIDAFCRAKHQTFAQAVHSNSLGMRLGDVRPELTGRSVVDYLPSKPLNPITVRHTIGLGDPLTDEDIDESDRADDGLPQSLAANIRAYGLTYFKIKIGGALADDRERLRRIATTIEENCTGEYAFSLDGNETYSEPAPFRALWESLQRDPGLQHFMQRLLFVEQPLTRRVALNDETGAALRAWANRPPIIIDESDGALESLPRALECGYAGTSHKNCKGIFKSIINACQIYDYRRRFPGQSYLLSAEDLANVGPVALLQDLTVVATLGISHAERNGHHYFAGLSIFPDEIQEQTLADHGDLYATHPGGFAILRIEEGKLALGSVLDAPFGTRRLPNLEAFAAEYSTGAES